MLLYSYVTYMNSKYFGHFQTLEFPISFSVVAFSSISVGIMLGVLLGSIDIQMNRLGIQKLSFGLVILIRILTYPLVFWIIMIVARFFLTNWINTLIPVDYSTIINSGLTWRYFYWTLLAYIAFMAAVVSFINQMNSKFGPGVLIPLLLGWYRKPKEQERIFMFLDLKSSTTHAENLGHVKYSSMIRDCFIDLNSVLTKNNAEIYQYVGDEAVITWPAHEGIRNMHCLAFFFNFKNRLNSRKEYYLKNYGFVPEFKAGLHLGILTAVEVGEIKREIAYHGDTINTAARIQSMCNTFGKSFLISESVKLSLPDNIAPYQCEYIGEISLKGKDKAVKLFGLELAFL